MSKANGFVSFKCVPVRTGLFRNQDQFLVSWTSQSVEN